MIHELKILPEFFGKVISGEKTFEVRKNDRPYNVGDMLALNEWDPVNGYTGNSCLVFVDYILNDSEYCKIGYITMSIKPCDVYKRTEPFDHCSRCTDYSVPLAT